MRFNLPPLSRTFITKSHQDTLLFAAFKREVNNGQNPDIKNFASQMLPTLEDHLKQAREMEKSVGVQSAKMQ